MGAVTLAVHSRRSMDELVYMEFLHLTMVEGFEVTCRGNPRRVFATPLWHVLHIELGIESSEYCSALKKRHFVSEGEGSAHGRFLSE